jgi:hypothetical protein
VLRHGEERKDCHDADAVRDAGKGEEMSEFTSLEASKRLAVAGFEAPEGFDTVGYPFKWLERAPGDVDLVEGWHGAESGDGPIAYRADTLLAWLLNKEWDIDIGQLHKLNDKIVIDAVLSGTNQNIATEGPTLCDALAELVLKVINA